MNQKINSICQHTRVATKQTTAPITPENTVFDLNENKKNKTLRKHKASDKWGAKLNKWSNLGRWGSRLCRSGLHLQTLKSKLMVQKQPYRILESHLHSPHSTGGVSENCHLRRCICQPFGSKWCDKEAWEQNEGYLTPTFNFLLRIEKGLRHIKTRQLARRSVGYQFVQGA